MFARSGEGNSIEQSQEVRAQSFEKGGLVWVSAGKARSFPLLELALGDAEHRLNIADPEHLSERILALLSHQVDLVPEVAQARVDRCRRQHQYFGLHAALEGLFKQAVIAAASYEIARVVSPISALIAEIVGFVDDDQIERTPIELGEIDRARPPLVAAEIGVRPHSVVQAVFLEGVVTRRRPGCVAGPIVLQPLWTQHQYPFVAQLEELDDGQRPSMSFRVPTLSAMIQPL